MPRSITLGNYQTQQQRFKAACRAEAARLNRLRKQKEKIEEKTNEGN